MITRMFKAAALTAVVCLPLAGCVVEDDDATPGTNVNVEAPEVDGPDLPDTDVDVDADGPDAPDVDADVDTE